MAIRIIKESKSSIQKKIEELEADLAKYLELYRKKVNYYIDVRGMSVEEVDRFVSRHEINNTKRELEKARKELEGLSEEYTIDFYDRYWSDKFEALPDGTTYYDPEGYNDGDATFTKHGNEWTSEDFPYPVTLSEYEFLDRLALKSSITVYVPKKE